MLIQYNVRGGWLTENVSFTLSKEKKIDGKKHTPTQVAHGNSLPQFNS